MEKKDIIILAIALALVLVSLYRKYVVKKNGSSFKAGQKPAAKNSLADQPDDYEPYSGKNSGA